MTEAPTPIAELIPETGWLAGFVSHAQATAMAPPEFLLAAGLAALSGCVGSKLWVQLGTRKRWNPHLWLLVMAPAGARKSTPAMLASEAIAAVRGSDVVLPTHWSPQAFFDALSETPDGFWDAGEISSFLRSAGQDYMATARTELCDIWDGKNIKRKLRKETIRVERPAMSAIATGRASDFAAAAGSADFSSGFLSRFLLLQAATPGPYRGLRAADGRLNSDHEAEWKALIAQLGTITHFFSETQQVKLTEDAIDLWERFDQGWMSEEVDDKLSGWASRRGIYSLKLAILHALARSGTPLIDVDDIAWGIEIMRAAWYGVVNLATESIGLDSKALLRDQAWKTAATMTDEFGFVSRRELVRRMWRTYDKRAIEDLLGSWESGGMIEIGRLRTGERGPATLGFRVLGGRPAPSGWCSASQKNTSETQHNLLPTPSTER